jgi:hypothetical protein
VAFEIKHRAIVIDTDQYAGNFERQMCAYLTGQFGDCGAGREIALSAQGEIEHLEWWKRHVAQVPNEHGIKRPVAIHPTPGYFNNGMGGHFLDVPEVYARAQEERIAALIKNQAPQKKLIEDRLGTGNFEEERPGAWTKEACERHLKDCEATIQRAINQGLQRHPAFLSVAIYVQVFPPQEVLEEMRERLDTFVGRLATSSGYGTKHGEKITVSGVRVRPD